MNSIRTSRTVRRIITVLVAFGAALGLTLIASPAQAASGVSYCFRYSNNAVYANQPVSLQIYTTSGWSTIASARTTMNGCGSFYMNGSYRNYYSRVLAQQNLVTGGVVRTSWIGTTPLMANPGNLAPFLGTGVVWCQAVTMSC